MSKHLFALVLALAGCTSMQSPTAGFRSDRISVETKGSGPDVILIAGLGSSPRIWDDTVSAVTGYRFHLVHVGGFDGAPAGANAAGSFLKPVAGEIARYASLLGKPALVGHSLGGTWAMMVALQRPRSVSKLMVVDMPPAVAPLLGGLDANADSVRPFAEQARSQILAARDPAARRQLAEMVVGSARDPAVRSAVIGHWLNSDPRVTGQGMYELLTTDLRPDMGRIEVPLLALWVVPERSPLQPDRARHYFNSSFGKARRATVREIHDSHHLIMFDQPDRFRRELADFLAGDES